MSGAPSPLVFGREGVIVPYKLISEKFGGARRANSFLRGFVVEENRTFAENFKARVVKKAFKIAEDDSGKKFVIFPLCKIPTLRKAGFVHGLKAGKGSFSPLRVSRRVAEENSALSVPLYEFQEAIVDFVCGERLKRGFGRAYLQLGTGLGKTGIGLAISAHLRVPTFVVVPTIAIRDQWLDECKLFLPNYRCSAFANTMRQKPSPETHDLVACVINTARRKRPEFFDGYGLLIIDEAHEAYAPCNLKVLWNAQTKYIVGLSATPLERPDGLDKIVTHFLGDVIWEKDIPGMYELLQQAIFPGRVEEIEYHGDPRFAMNIVGSKGYCSAGKTVRSLIRDPARLRLVALEAKRLYESGHSLFVFSEFRDFTIEIKDQLKTTLGVDFDEIEGDSGFVSVLRGGATKEDVSRARTCRIVLTTYGFSRRGISFRDMTALIMATPLRNGMRQIIGRILRQGSDPTVVREVVDIIDHETFLRRQSTTRRKVYQEKEYPIRRRKVFHEKVEEGLAGN